MASLRFRTLAIALTIGIFVYPFGILHDVYSSCYGHSARFMLLPNPWLTPLFPKLS